MLSPQSITAIQQHITNNNRYIGKKPDIKVYDHLWLFYRIKYFQIICFSPIDLHDGMSTSEDRSSKGIPFLSERSKRRVEVADQAIDDDHADQLALVGERAFEDILREVSLL